MRTLADRPVRRFCESQSPPRTKGRSLTSQLYRSPFLTQSPDHEDSNALKFLENRDLHFKIQITEWKSSFYKFQWKNMAR